MGQGEVEAHVTWLRRLGKRPGTIQQRRYCLARVARHLSPADLLDATTERLEDYLGAVNRSVSSRAGEISHLRAFFGWAYEEGLIASDPAAKLIRPRLPRRLPRPMSAETFARAVELAPDEIRAWLYLGRFAGLRCCEIAPLTGEDYLRSAGVLILREMKGGDSGAVPVSPTLASVIDPLPRYGIWFPRHDGKPGSMSAAQVSRLGNAFLRSVGIDDTMHSLRHSFGSDAYVQSGRDLRLTQELLRHRDPGSTAIYTYVDPGEAAAVVARMAV